ncbi:MAG: serine/threonine-protein kinase [Nostoc sp. DedQUE04]|uniref:serine/threonine protein kinase n=1 Tax=Nostoc sp. DedQUE04 TaxID=3075390 RepID=UPI002AD4ED6E|nr:serine/threonine-protein kinase [Nostoc sp. DedQUE04]MDZ8137518.1 serine/threonine-protein kinase [Nostoc sp. DedQUE04]
MPWIAGQQLQGGKYVIETVLGQGGFGITYKALHVELNQTVVIKTPNEYLSHDPEYDKYIERFIQEGRILARLSEDPHPHIVGVIDLFREGATHCLVMDFVEGENLFEAVKRRGILPEAEIVPCIRQIGEALMVVHQARLVHRDVHPKNIMLRSNGKAVLIDFGIAKQVVPSTDSSINKDGHKAFAPYEQKVRGSRELTVDIYSLAATLYYAVTGQFPTNSLARKLDNTSLTPPKQINPSISDELNQAILKGIALEANDRPQSMQAWLTMLEAPKATPPPPVDRDYKKEVVRPEAKLNLKAIPGTSSTKSLRTIPWSWLIAVLISTLLIGYLLAASNASYIVWAVAVVWAEAMAWTGAWSWSLTVAEAVGVTVVGTVVVTLVVAGTVAGSVSMAVVVAAGMAGENLRKSFSKIHTFLILASISSLGLGLGWLGHKILNTGT